MCTCGTWACLSSSKTTKAYVSVIINALNSVRSLPCVLNVSQLIPQFTQCCTRVLVHRWYEIRHNNNNNNSKKDCFWCWALIWGGSGHHKQYRCKIDPYVALLISFRGERRSCWSVIKKTCFDRAIKCEFVIFSVVAY